MFALFISFVLLLSFSPVIAFNYCYPIVAVDNQGFLATYQKNLGDLELWRIFPENGKCEKCLDWRFAPSGLKVLPDQSGFSFIDTGQLRIKKFIMRSPKIVEFGLPLHGIGDLNWIDQDNCFFSAKQHQHFAIYKGSITNSQKLTSCKESAVFDYLMPNLVDQSLFYIERQISNRSCRIERFNIIRPNQSVELILDCNYQQVIHLQMFDSNSGFYIEHMPYLKDQVQMIGFIGHLFCNSENQWREAGQFKFQIPKQFLLGEARAQESIGIFWPVVKKTALYFINFKQNQGGEYIGSLNCYDLATGKIIPILESDSKVWPCGLLIWQNRLYYGKILEEGLNQKNFETDLLNFIEL